MIVDLLIPALDEEAALPLVLAALPYGRLRRVVVVDNGSRDRTAEVARAAGATVVRELRRGYGSACLAGLAFLAAQEPPPDVVAFLDGDGADDSQQLERLLAPIEQGAADFVLGARLARRAAAGALTPQQRAGNFIATRLIALLYGHRFSDLGPFRAIRWSALASLQMADTGHGWTVEMQVKAVRQRLRIQEVPIAYQRRVAGRSKVSGTVRGTLGAAYKILSTVARLAVSQRAA